MFDPARDAYGGNYPKARRLALARSSGKCQFCGLRKATDGHHWAHPDNYPSGEQVQGHDLTALCKTCHELAGMLRDWVLDKGASMDELAADFRHCNTFIAKREAFSYWLYPEENEEFVVNTDIPAPILKTRDRAKNVASTPSEPQKEPSIKDDIYGWQVQVDHLKDVRSAIKRQMDRLERGESLDTPTAWEDAALIDSELTLSALSAEYKSVGRQMADAIRNRERLRKQQGIGRGCGFFLTLCLLAPLLYVVYLMVTLPR